MKPIQLTPQIETYVRNALGADADLNSISVYEAIAFNTRPVRKKHPLYKGARADRGLLQEMAAALATESRPLQIQHDTEALPSGRVFHGEVVDKGAESELRTLFFVDNQHADLIAKINNGTIDQVSVSVVSKHVYNSVSGFDYFGPDADFEHVWTGTDPDGNTIGENGVYARLVGLDSFFELSLVGMGGAENARIVHRDQSHFGSSYQKLAASGVDPNALVLVATVEAENMDLTALVTELTDNKAQVATLTATNADLTTQVADLTAANAALTTKLAEAGDSATALAAKDTEIADLTTAAAEQKANLDTSIEALQDVAKKVLAASGQVDADIPSDLADLTAIINATEGGLAAALVAGGQAEGADAGSVDDPVAAPADLSAFRTSRK